MKDLIVQLLLKELREHLSADAIQNLIEIPPDANLGDYAFPCFSLAKIFRKNPAAIAEDLKAKLQGAAEITKIAAVSGYLNFFIDKKHMAEYILQAVFSEGFGKKNSKRRVVVESPSPNTNKPLHLGHLRNMALGKSVAHILGFNGNEVITTSINNDRGIHICKSMLAYQKFGQGLIPEQTGKKSDHFVGDYYVLFNAKEKEDPDFIEQVRNMLLKWEADDPETVELWRRMNAWAIAGFKETYRLFGIHLDKEYFESQIYKQGKEIILDGLARGIFFQKEDGKVAVNLEDEKLGEKVLLRADGTAIYIVQDLYLAELKYIDFHYDLSIYVVGNEQEYHFKALSAILKKLGKPFADKGYHLSYGMVELPEGKMKSREGTVVDADDLILETQNIAKEEVAKRYQLSQSELDERSLKIALAAIKYQLLKIEVAKNMVFNPKEAIKFEGDTGPYLLYSYARASSILRKAGNIEAYQIPDLSEHEIRFLKKLFHFSEALGLAYDKLSPAYMAGYAFDLAKAFNEFYHNCPVIHSETKHFRLTLVKAFKVIMKKSLNLLGIEEIEEM